MGWGILYIMHMFLTISSLLQMQYLVVIHSMMTKSS